MKRKRKENGFKTSNQLQVLQALRKELLGDLSKIVNKTKADM